MSERITWVRCLSCGGPAAVGWIGDEPVEFDCPRGCPQLGGQLDGRAAAEHVPGAPAESTEHLDVLAWSRDLCERSGWLREQARFACVRSRVTVREIRASRQARGSAVRARAVDSGRGVGMPRSPRQRRPGGAR
jgi:hypothetical protein